MAYRKKCILQCTIHAHHATRLERDNEDASHVERNGIRILQGGTVNGGARYSLSRQRSHGTTHTIVGVLGGLFPCADGGAGKENKKEQMPPPKFSPTKIRRRKGDACIIMHHHTAVLSSTEARSILHEQTKDSHVLRGVKVFTILRTPDHPDQAASLTIDNRLPNKQDEQERKSS